MSFLGPDLGMPHHPHFSGGNTAQYQPNDVKGAMTRASTASGAPLIQALFGKGAMQVSLASSMNFLNVSIATHFDFSKTGIFSPLGGFDAKVFGLLSSKANAK